MKEEWKKVFQFEWLYEVSNLGNVKSLPRRWAWKERILKPWLTTHKYRQVMLWKDSKQYWKRVHCLVMEAFVWPRPSTYDINHINWIKTDNRLENLEYCTKSENLKHLFHTLWYKGNKGKKYKK